MAQEAVDDKVQGDEIRAELEAEIKAELEILDTSNHGKYGYAAGKLTNEPSDIRRRCMMRHHVRKLNEARKLYEELFGECEF